MYQLQKDILFDLNGIDGTQLLTAVTLDAVIVVDIRFFVFYLNCMYGAGLRASSASYAGLSVDLGVRTEKFGKSSAEQF